MNAGTLSVLLVRFLGFAGILFGAGSLVAGLAASYGKVGLVYWQTFLLSVLLPPVLLILGGLVLLLLARPVARLLARGLE